MMVNKANIRPHRPGQKRKAKVPTVCSQVGVVGRDEWFMQKLPCSQPGGSKNDGVDQVNNVGIKLIEAANKKGTKEVEFEFWIEWKRQTRRTNHLRTGIVIYATFRAEQ